MAVRWYFLFASSDFMETFKWHKLQPSHQVWRKKGRGGKGQFSGFLPGLVGMLVGNAIRKKRGKRRVKINAGQCIKDAVDGQGGQDCWTENNPDSGQHKDVWDKVFNVRTLWN